MEFGDKEWFKKLEEHYPFPMYIAFYIASDGSTNSRGIETKVRETGNIQYRKVVPSRFVSGWETALVSVVNCKTAQDYYDEVVRIKQVWKLE